LAAIPSVPAGDDAAFNAHFRPRILGLPQPVFAAIVAGGVTFIAVLLYLLLS
jgi:hypothetical protein